MKRFLISTVAAVMIAGSVNLPAFADQGRGPQQGYGYSQGQDERHDNRYERRDDRRDDRYDRRDDRRVQVSIYHDARTEWRDTRRHAVWNDRDHNGYYIGRVWYFGQPSARVYRQRGFALGYRPLHRGDRIIVSGNHYREVDYRDYRDYRVERPPQGYHWVKSDNGDLILAALAGGLIAAIIANN